MTRQTRVTAGIAATSFVLTLLVTNVWQRLPAPTAQVGGSSSSCASPVLTFVKSDEEQHLVGPFTTDIVDLTSADINHDGKADLITRQKVFLGNGDGTVTAAPFTPQATGYGQVMLADINGDGEQDMMYGGAGQGIVVRQGNAAGGFASQIVTPVEGGSGWVAAGQFDGDGKMDIATGNSLGLFIYLGNGDGTFRLHKRYGYVQNGDSPMPVGPLAAADVNKDGKTDLAFLDRTANLQIWHGQGNGDFAWNMTIPNAGSFLSGHWMLQLIAMDYTGDGKVDFLTSNPTGSRINVISRLSYNENWQITSPYVTSGAPMAFAIADFDGNGTRDAALTTQFSSVHILQSGPVQGFLATISPANQSQAPGAQGITAADFDRDGRMDLAFIRSYGALEVYLNKLVCPSSSSSSAASSAAAPGPVLSSSQSSASSSGFSSSSQVVVSSVSSTSSASSSASSLSSSSRSSSISAGTGPSICKPLCGDRLIVKGKEECDDGNTKNGDGCSSTCKVEPNYVCSPP